MMVPINPLSHCRPPLSLLRPAQPPAEPLGHPSVYSVNILPRQGLQSEPSVPARAALARPPIHPRIRQEFRRSAAPGGTAPTGGPGWRHTRSRRRVLRRTDRWPWPHPRSSRCAHIRWCGGGSAPAGESRPTTADPVGDRTSAPPGEVTVQLAGCLVEPARRVQHPGADFHGKRLQHLVVVLARICQPGPPRSRWRPAAAVPAESPSSCRRRRAPARWRLRRPGGR